MAEKTSTRVKRCDERASCFISKTARKVGSMRSCKIVFIRLKFFAGLLRVFILNTCLSNGLSAGFEMIAAWLPSLLFYTTLVVLMLCLPFVGFFVHFGLLWVWGEMSLILYLSFF